MFALADVVYLFADEFAGLRGGRFSLFFVALGAFQRFFFRHVAPDRVDWLGPISTVGARGLAGNRGVAVTGLIFAHTHATNGRSMPGRGGRVGNGPWR